LGNWKDTVSKFRNLIQQKAIGTYTKLTYNKRTTNYINPRIFPRHFEGEVLLEADPATRVKLDPKLGKLSLNA
jgi:hypothetical protein